MSVLAMVIAAKANTYTSVIAPNLAPPDGGGTTTVTVTTPTEGATIFYAVAVTPTNPTHTGSTPTGITVSVTSGASFSVPSGRTLRALTWVTGFADSEIVEGYYGP